MSRIPGAWRAAIVAALSVVAQVAAGYSGWPTMLELLFLLLAVVITIGAAIFGAQALKKVECVSL